MVSKIIILFIRNHARSSGGFNGNGFLATFRQHKLHVISQVYGLHGWDIMYLIVKLNFVVKVGKAPFDKRKPDLGVKWW